MLVILSKAKNLLILSNQIYIKDQILIDLILFFKTNNMLF